MQRLVWWIGGLVSMMAPAWMRVLPLNQPNQAGKFFQIDPAAVLIGVLTLLFAIKTYRLMVPKRDLTLTAIADELAVAVRRLWDKEAELRRLNDPHPLPVSWEAADSDLVEDWSLIAMTARSWPGKPPSDPSGWATQPSGLRGSDNELGEVLSRRVPTGRLVVLGEPGAGKSMLLVRLVLDLLARRDPGGPVPVLVPLATWNPHKQDLHTWLASRLVTDHPGLRELAPGAVGKMNRVRALLDHYLLLPILDGLDEMPDTVRGPAIAKINEALRPGDGLVLSSRVAEYHEAIQPKDGPHVKLRGAAGVILSELDPIAIETYLRRDAGSAASDARWNAVVDVLGTTEPVAQALRTPLMVGLARTIYSPRPGEQAKLPNPAELCDTTRFPTPTDVERHLFDAFIPAAYRRHPNPDKRCRWPAADAQRWLVYLAIHLEKRRPKTINLEWWELRRAAPRRLSGLAVAIVAGLATGLTAAVGADIGVGIGTGLGLGLLLGLAVSRPLRDITQFAAGPVFGLVGGLIGGLFGGFVAGLADLIGIGDASGLIGPLPIGLGVGMGIGPASGGLVGGLVGGLAGGLGGGLVGALGVGLAAGLLNGLGVGLAAGLSVEFIGRRRPASAFRWSPAGLAGGLAVGLAVGAAAWFVAGPTSAIAIVLFGGTVAALAVGLTAAAADLKTAAGPRAVLARDRRIFAIFGIVVAVATGPIAGVAVGLVAATEQGVEPSLALLLAKGTGVALTTALVLGLTFAFIQAAWGSYTLARCWLALWRHLPWRLTAFLADAHEQRGVLRQVGAVYQFRHIELQRYLATL